MSFKDQLNLFIRDKGYATYNELEMFAKSKGHKVETMTRALRPSESPNLERIMKGSAIIAYRWKNATQGQNMRVQACCNDMVVFGTHFKPCINQKEVVNGLF